MGERTLVCGVASDEPESLRVINGLTKTNRTIASQVEDLISRNPVIVFSSARSRACKTAKIYLAHAAAEFAVVELESLLVGNALAYEKSLRAITGQRAYPWIFVGGAALGEDVDIAALAETGALKEMCASAGTPALASRLCRQTS